MPILNVDRANSSLLRHYQKFLTCSSNFMKKSRRHGVSSASLVDLYWWTGSQGGFCPSPLNPWSSCVWGLNLLTCGYYYRKRATLLWFLGRQVTHLGWAWLCPSRLCEGNWIPYEKQLWVKQVKEDETKIFESQSYRWNLARSSALGVPRMLWILCTWSSSLFPGKRGNRARISK